jgi:hypothetical protein
MSLPAVLENVKKHPGMYVYKVEFDSVAAFIDGFNLATNGGLLVGFREWLIVKLGYGDNLAWPALALRLAFPEAESPASQLLHADNQKRAVAALFEFLEAFLQEREAPDGLRRLFLGYEAWLRRQDWYRPSSPGWIADEGAGVEPVARNNVVRRKRNGRKQHATAPTKPGDSHGLQ